MSLLSVENEQLPA